MPRVISVIQSDVSRGKGTVNDPCRNVTQYHDMDGLFLAERDPVAEERAEQNARTVEAWPRTISEERALKVETILALEDLLKAMDTDAPEAKERALMRARAIVSGYRGDK